MREAEIQREFDERMRAARESIEAQIKRCPLCGERFFEVQRGQKYCGRPCGTATKSKRYRARKQARLKELNRKDDK